MIRGHADCGHATKYEMQKCTSMRRAERLVPSVYKAACEQPGLSSDALGRRAGITNNSVRYLAILKAEERGVIYRKPGRRRLRLCYPRTEGEL